jgi:hypothetical protein
MDINEFSREIRLAWQAKYGDIIVPDEGAIRRLADSSGYDVEYCKETLAGMPDKDKRGATPGVPLFIRYCKEGWNSGKKQSHIQVETYFDSNTGRSYQLQKDFNGRQYYNFPIATSEFRRLTERGFQLEAAHIIEVGMECAELHARLEKQFDYLFKSGQLNEMDHGRAMVGIEILKGSVDIDLHFNKQETEQADVPF